MPRINMAFAPENLEYLRTMAALCGESITAYVNRLIEEDQEKRAATYAAIKGLRIDTEKGSQEK